MTRRPVSSFLLRGFGPMNWLKSGSWLRVHSSSFLTQVWLIFATATYSNQAGHWKGHHLFQSWGHYDQPSKVKGLHGSDSFDFFRFSAYILLVFCDFVVVQLLDRVRLFATSWTAAHQAFRCFTISQSLLKLMSIELVMPSNHLTLCRPLLLLPSIFPSIRVFSNESVLHNRWPKFWSFSFSISPSIEYSRLISCKIDSLDLLVV